MCNKPEKILLSCTLILLISAVLVAAVAGIAAAVPPDPTAPGPYTVASMQIDYGCDWDLDGTTIIWTDPTFYGTTQYTIPLSDDDLSPPDDGRCADQSKVDMKSWVYYPSDGGGGVAPGGPFPLVAILHGQQVWSIEGYKGYQYLGDLLASHGFIVASIDGRSFMNASIASRGEHVREWLRRFVSMNSSDSGSIFEGKVDLSKVSLMGHSRGGEAVVAAWEWQRVQPDSGYSIAAVISIAPVQFFGIYPTYGGAMFLQHMRDVAYMIIHGSKDGDVSDFQGYRLYDRSADFRQPGETPKELMFVKDANHNFFNSIWETQEGDDYCCGGTLTGTKARNVAKAYMNSFLQAYVLGNTEYLDYLSNLQPNPVSTTTVALDYQTPSSEHLVIDHNEEWPGDSHNKKLNTLGGAIKVKTLPNYAERFIYKSATSPFSSYKGETWAASLDWDAAADLYKTIIPAGTTFDPNMFDHFSFRVGQVYRSSGSPNPPDANQDFRIAISDYLGNKSPWLNVSSYGPIYPPWLTSEGGTKTVMSVIRLPLADFTGVDLNQIKMIRFKFNAVPAGEIVFDDLRFTK
ncbi:MAG: alpha/beta hydrolase [Nitrospiraceae bacterium]|nr:MAG: alpha/beta hydrolase [Nitrospiraceae bacterium]